VIIHVLTTGRDWGLNGRCAVKTLPYVIPNLTFTWWSGHKRGSGYRVTAV